MYWDIPEFDPPFDSPSFKSTISLMVQPRTDYLFV
jgi:hypothetical protein